MAVGVVGSCQGRGDARDDEDAGGHDGGDGDEDHDEDEE